MGQNFILTLPPDYLCLYLRELTHGTGRSYALTVSATPNISANSAILTNIPLSVWRKIARFGLLFRSSSSSCAAARESRGKGCMITVFGSQCWVYTC